MAASALQPVKRVVVVGAGIGGLTVANALRRRGLNVQVLERAAKFIPTAGAGFGFSPNGQACLDSIGLPYNIGHPFLDHVIFSGNEVLARSDHLARAKERWGLAVQGTLRADLIDLLAEPLLADGALRYSTVVTGVEQTRADKVRVLLGSGEALEADLVVGADGINSTVAAAVQPAGAAPDPPVFSNENIVYGVIPLKNFKPLASSNSEPGHFIGRPHTLVQAFDRGEFISFSCGRDANANPTTLVWAITYASATPPTRRHEEWTKAKAGQGTVRELAEKLLLDKYGPDCPTLGLVQQTPEDRLLHFGLFYRRVKDVWSKGRVVLLGDSAHATLPYAGQGANQAIEDSVVLTKCLEDANGFRDVDGALQAYFEKRYARTKKIVQTSLYMGKLMHTEGQLANWTRDTVLRWLIKRDIILKIGERELIDHCPVPLPTMRARV